MKPSKQIQDTIDLTTGVVGLGVVNSVGAAMPAGMAKTITMSGTLPIASVSLMGSAANYGQPRKKRR